MNYNEKIGDNISIEDLQSKAGMNKQNKIDFALRTPDLFENKKIVIRKTGDSLICAYDDNNFYFDTLVHGIYETDKKFDLKFLMGILNSYPATYFYRLLHDIKGKVFAKISLKNLGMFPIPEILLEEQKPLINLVDEMIQLNKDLTNEINGFKDWLNRTYKIDKFSKKLDKYYELSFEDFLNELKKKKINIKPRETQELLKKEFEGSLSKIDPLLKKILKTDNEINQMVYELYGLSEDEIKIIEDSLD